MTLASCPYCLPGSFDGPFSDAHVVPAKLGGTLVVRAHERCNGGAAVHIDNPVMRDPDVEILRGLSGAKNTRTGRFRGAQFPGDLADQAPALLRANPQGIVVEQVAAGRPQLTADGEFVFSTPASNVDAHTEKVLEGLRQKHPGKTVELIAQEARHGDVSIERSWGLLPWVWPRFAAKVALGVLSLTMPPEWRGSDGELFLLALFRIGHVYGSPTGGVSAVPTQLEHGERSPTFLYPWEHAIIVHPKENAVFVTVVLFGELRYSLGIATDLKPIGPRVWLCDYREKQEAASRVQLDERLCRGADG